MKKILSLTVLFILGISSFAQDCKSNLYMTQNAKFTVTIYDKKGAVSGIKTSQITDVKKSGDSYTSTISTSFTDGKGKTLSNGAGSYKCSGGILSADMKLFMPQEQTSKMGDGAEVKVDPVYLEYPANPSVGQSLKDAEFKMDIDMKNGLSTSTAFKEENRKVASKESITTPAGTWDAYLITYDGNLKTKVAGIGIPFNFSVKEWYVPGTGIVKSESYSKGGKLSGSSVLTAITK